MIRKASKQAGANCDVFDALPLGATFCLYGYSPRLGYLLHERYAKIDDLTVQSVTDGRRWPLACTEGSGSSVVLVPDGSYSIVPFDVDRRR